MKQSAKATFHHLSRHKFDAAMANGLVYAGVDEVGRGCLAGPVVAAAVIPPVDIHSWHHVDDSKRVKGSIRRDVADHIRLTARAVGIGAATVEEIDEYNILQATKLAMRRAIMNLDVTPEILFVDGNQSPQSDVPSIVVVDGDSRSLAIAAASIVAKVYRDEWMQRIGDDYPAYDFFHNVGYGTPTHLEALRTLGPTPYHRHSFAPVREASTKQMRLPLHG